MTEMELMRLRHLIRKEVRMKWRVRRAEAKATKTTTVLTGMPRGGGRRSQVEDGAIALSEIKEVYDGVRKELKALRDKLEPLIENLDDPDQAEAMQWRYMSGYSAEDIADAMNFSDRQIYRILKKAEKKVVSECQKKM